MQPYVLEVLRSCTLFNGLSAEEIVPALACLSAVKRTYDKNATVFSEGGEVGFVGIVLMGEAEARKTDYNGNVNIISRFFPADIIAASACYSQHQMPFDVVCPVQTEILCLETRHLISPCKSVCKSHLTLISNMLRVIAEKNILLAKKMDVLSRRSIREKVLAYLHSCARSGEGSFCIPLSRRQLADYLYTNRSALSRELSALKEEGIIDFYQNRFTFIKGDNSN